MRKHVRLIALAGIAALSLALGAPPDDLDAFIQAQMSQREINGLSLAVIHDGRIDARAYGVTSRGGAPVTTTTLFQAGSISKPVAAMGALRLVDQGLLSLDGDVNANLKTWKVPENEFTKTQKVSLRRLLSHTAGLTVHGFPGYDVQERMPSVAEVLDGKGNTAAVRVDVVPGSLSRYSGGGYTVMQQLVTDVTGKPFQQYMSEAVLGPLAMKDSTYQQPLPSERAARTASGYHADRSPVSGKWHVYPEMAAAGLWTTATDLARFAIEVQQSLSGTSNRVISQSIARQMVSNEAENYGLGLGVSGTGAARTFGHGGRDDGFDARLHAFTEGGRGVVVMINANDNSRFIGRIVRYVAAKYKWPESSPSVPAATERKVPNVPLDPIDGYYELSNNNMLMLSAHDGSLFTYVNGLRDEEFLFMGGDRFGSADRNVTFRIARGPEGEVVGLTWSDGKDRMVPRIGPLFAAVQQAKDPNPSLTQKVESAVRALAKDREALNGQSQMTPGARAELSVPVREFAGLRSLAYLSAQDVTGRKIERHGSAVARVLFYRLETAAGNQQLLVHVTGDNLITDYDIVDK
jgi:CubicO group peptidase (beta-lactamase class C family)